MLAWKDYLPNFQGALANFYEEKVKPTIESKSSEYKELLKENFVRGAKVQKALVVIAFGILLLLALAFFWKDGEGIQWKYLLLGLLISYAGNYVLELKLGEALK